MKIEIEDKRKIAEVQEEFNTVFPYLRIEFCRTPGNSNGRDGRILDDKATLRSGMNRTGKGLIEINSKTTASDLAKQFQDISGMNILIFRKSGKAWIEITVTNSWTLVEQNRQGELITRHMDEDLND